MVDLSVVRCVLGYVRARSSVLIQTVDLPAIRFNIFIYFPFFHSFSVQLLNTCVYGGGEHVVSFELK